MYCESLDFSLTDQQLPMFLKLMYLCIALHNKSDLTSQESTKSSEEAPESNQGISDEELGLFKYIFKNFICLYQLSL